MCSGVHKPQKRKFPNPYDSHLQAQPTLPHQPLAQRPAPPDWETEDEARKLARRHEAARAARATAAAEQAAAQQAAQGLLLAEELSAQEELAKVCGGVSLR